MSPDAVKALDSARLEWLLANQSYVGTTSAGLFAMRDWRGIVYGNHYKTPREAIDASMGHFDIGGALDRLDAAATHQERTDEQG